MIELKIAIKVENCPFSTTTDLLAILKENFVTAYRPRISKLCCENKQDQSNICCLESG